MTDSHETNHAAEAGSRHADGVRGINLGFNVKDDRAYHHIDPAFGLSVINTDADCKYLVSTRQLLMLLEVARLLETPRLPPEFDGLSYLRGFLAGMKNGTEPLLTDYQTPQTVKSLHHSHECCHCPHPDGLCGNQA